MNTNQTEKRVALACLIGAVIGGLLALEFNRHLWWAGVLIGGGVAYLSYEFEKVLTAVKMVWKSTWIQMTRERKSPRINWDWEETKRRVLFGWTEFSEVCGTAFLGFSVILIVLSWGFLPWAFDLYGPWTAFGVTLILVFFPTTDRSIFLAGVGLVGSAFPEDNSKLNDISFRSSVKEGLRMLILANGIVLVALVILRVVVRMPKVITFLWRVAKRTFILIHSELRLLCMTDAMIGATAGYFLDNVLVGGLIGAGCGVINYRLVSIRWLKLAPR